jgi:ubiquitin-protein ligase
MHRRIYKEYEELQKANETELGVKMVGDNIHKWKAFIKGPTGTPYDGAIFKFNIEFPTDYPLKPPKLHFTTPVWHPNFDEDSGSICLDILKSEWSPALSVHKVLISVISLLNDPNPHSPLNGLAAQQYMSRPAEFAKAVKDWVAKHGAKTTEL